MNYNSQLCRFISDNENWQELLEEKKIKVSTEGPLAIFNYKIECDFRDPVVQEARGIIINLDTLEVVCWPFRKFGNWNESYADTIDWTTAKVQEKLDGSIIKLWYDELQEKWRFSTNSTIDASQASADVFTKESYYDLVKKTDNYHSIPFAALDHNNTYIFELVGPQNRMVIDYPFSRLYHIGTRNKKTGRESLTDIGIVRPAEYPLHSLNECIEAAKKLNQGVIAQSRSGSFPITDSNSILAPQILPENLPASDLRHAPVDKEGFVVVDIAFNRIKIKSPDYLVIHHTIGRGNFTKERVVELLNNREINIDNFCADYPAYAVFIRYYQYKLAELEYELEPFLRTVRNLYEEYSHERKAVAMIIKGKKYASFGFAALDNDKTAREMINELSTPQLLRFIPDYVPNPVFE